MANRNRGLLFSLSSLKLCRRTATSVFRSATLQTRLRFADILQFSVNWSSVQ